MNNLSGRIPQFLRLSVLIVTLVAGLAWFGQSRSFADESPGWAVVETSGDARVRVGDGAWTSLAQGEILVPQSELKTTKDGRVVLAKDGDVITVSPNSRMAIPESDGGAAANIFQSLGTLLFKMETRPERGFRVQTPVLAAAIKGTTFTVTVNNEGAGLHVVEGSVEVTALDTGQVAMIYPGQTVSVAAVPGAGLSIIEGRQSRFDTQNQEGSPALAGEDDVQGKSAKSRSQRNSDGKSAIFRGTAKIGNTLGKSNRDISKLTNGLIANASQGHGIQGGPKAKGARSTGYGQGVGKDNSDGRAKGNTLDIVVNDVSGPGVPNGHGKGAGGLGAMTGTSNGASGVAAIASQGQGQGNNGKGRGKGMTK